MEKKINYKNYLVKVDESINYIGTNQFGETYLVISSRDKKYRYTLNLKNKYAYKGFIKISFPEDHMVPVYMVEQGGSTFMSLSDFVKNFNIFDLV